MKNISLTAVLILIFFTFGCGLLDRFKGNADRNSNVPVAAPSPAVTAAPSATPAIDSTPSEQSVSGRNLMAFSAGTTVVASTSEAANDAFTGARTINNEGAQGGWQTASGKAENQSLTLELPARTTFKTLVFDTYYGYPKQFAAKDVRVEISDASPTDGFQTILETTLQDGKNGQIFSVSREIAGRFVRYTTINNYGSPDAVRTGEIRGYGEQEPVPDLQNLSGTYKETSSGTSFGTVFHLKQEGLSVIGCYEGGNEWTFQGTVDGRVVNDKLRDKHGLQNSGSYSFTLDGGKFSALSWAGDKKQYDTFAAGEKVSDKIGNCAQMPDLDGKQDVAKDNLEKELAEKGKAILYGINFDFNSDAIKPESKPTLDKVIAILKEKTDWKFSVEGHTDNVGGEAFNQTLSEKRAASVVKYLTGAGIEQNRLSSKGYGLTKPIAPNNSESERAQNRRVELVKQ